MHPHPAFDPTFLRHRFPGLDVDFRVLQAPLTPPTSIEEDWLIRVTPVGPSGRVQVEARPHRRSAWSSDPLEWPHEVRAMAKAKRDGLGRAVSRLPYDVWRSLKGARAKARRVIEVVLRAVCAVAVPLVPWVEAVVRTERGVVSARIPQGASRCERQAFLDWVSERCAPHDHALRC
jgi:hypothetical protein